MKLTRKAIAEGLEAVPMDVVILGAANSKEKRLTPKQREFARQIALGETKAGAYRKAYNSKGKPKVVHTEGAKLIADPRISSEAEAIKLAIEAERSRTPAHLRALVVQKLTEKALDTSIPPAQQIKALELLGKITEVALFTERREVVQVKDSGEIRARLMDSIRQAIKSQAVDAEVVDADSLLAEISGDQPEDSHISGDNVTNDGEAGEPDQSMANGQAEDSHIISDNVTTEGEGLSVGGSGTPPVGHPPELAVAQQLDLHSNPHNESPSFSSHSESPTLSAPTVWVPSDASPTQNSGDKK